VRSRLDPPLGERLRLRPRFDRSEPDRRVMATALAWLLLSVGTLVLGWLALVRPEAAEAWLGALLVGAAYGLALIAILGWDRFPVWAFAAGSAGASALVELALWVSGVEALALALAGIAAYAGCLLGSRGALIQGGWILTVHAVRLAVLEGPAGARLVDLLGTAALLGVITALVLGLRAGVKRALSRLIASSRTDAATGLLNASALGEVLGSEIERARRSGTRMSVLLVEPEAASGHSLDPGEEVLGRIGTVIAGAIRRIDTVGRFDGDRLAVLAPTTHDSGAYILAERLATTVRSATEREAAPLAVSIGVASYPRHAQDMAGVLDAVRRALDEATRLGSGRVVVYEPPRTTLAQRMEDLGLTT
jgi:diguanylate cyclase (GGDEF)-like protein